MKKEDRLEEKRHLKREIKKVSIEDSMKEESKAMKKDLKLDIKRVWTKGTVTPKLKKVLDNQNNHPLMSSQLFSLSTH